MVVTTRSFSSELVASVRPEIKQFADYLHVEYVTSDEMTAVTST